MKEATVGSGNSQHNHARITTVGRGLGPWEKATCQETTVGDSRDQGDPREIRAMTNLCRGPDCACLEVTGVVAKLRYGGLCPVCVCPTSLICGEMVWPLGAAGSCVAGAPLVQARRAAADVGPGRRLTLQLVLCTSKGLKPGRGCPRFLGTDRKSVV